MSRKSFFFRFSDYLKERLDPAQTLFLCFSFGLVCTNIFSVSTWVSVSVSMYLILLQLRLTDEVKDLKHDKVHYPNRPVPRGLVSIVEILEARYVVVIFEIILLALNSASFYIYLFLQVYFYLMSKEFFIKKWIRKRFTVYVLLHEISAMPLFLYLFSFNIKTVSYPFLTSLILTFCLFSLEIARKIRKSSDYKAKDTYVEVYGYSFTKLLIFCLIAFSLILVRYVFQVNLIPLLLVGVWISLSLLSVNYKVVKWGTIFSVIAVIWLSVFYKFF